MSYLVGVSLDNTIQMRADQVDSLLNYKGLKRKAAPGRYYCQTLKV